MSSQAVSTTVCFELVSSVESDTSTALLTMPPFPSAPPELRFLHCSPHPLKLQYPPPPPPPPQDILRQVVPAIPPAARVFFGLCDLKTGYCMSHYQTLSAVDCKHQYQVRVFVNSRENGFQFQKMPGKAAYDYYYSQVRVLVPAEI